MTRFLSILLLALPFCLTGCERSPGPVPEGAVILVFGDSIASGTGATAGESFPAVLERLMGRKVVNAGVPGELTREGLKRLPGVLAEVRPHLVILCHGGEDMTMNVEADEIIANLRKMVQLIGEARAEVFMIAVPPPAPHFQPAPFYNHIAREMEVSIEVYTLSNVLSDKETRSEGLHPNAKGYAALARELAKRLQTAQR